MDLRNNSSQPAQLTALYELLDREGKVVATSSEQIHLKAGGVETVNFQKTLPDVRTWTSEDPQLYQLLMTCLLYTSPSPRD